MAVAIVLFGVKADAEKHATMDWTSGLGTRYGWSYWVGAAAAGACLLSTTMYACIGRT
jgi:hypothetical protein